MCVFFCAIHTKNNYQMLIVQRATLRPNRVGMGLLSSADLVVGKVLASKQNQSIFEGELRGEKCCVKQVPLVDSALAWNEAEVLAKLGPSELFPRFFGVAQDKNSLFVVTERLRPVDGAHAAEHLLQLASAVGLMHAKQLCHRDIKLANVMMGSTTTTAKLMDFDRSCEFYELEHLEPVGTLTHMAPELLCWELPCTEKIDSYAFGITMFEMMHPGEKPYPGYTTPGLPGSLTREEVVKKIVDDKWRPQWTHENSALKRLAERCWSDSPRDRPDFTEIVRELSTALNFPKPLPPTPAPVVAAALPTPHTMQTIGSSTSIGHVRTTMEDASCMLVAPEFTLLGAFDGLRSHHTSSFASRLFPLLYRDSLKLAFTETNELLKQMHFTCGSTATVVVVSATTIKAGWLGDSSAYLFTKTKLTPVRYQVKDLIVKHSPEREDEKFRIEQCGGQVKRDQAVMDDGSRMAVGPWRAVADASASHAMGIAISRALGLFKFQPVISPQPEFITVQRRPEDRFLVVATDGLWDLVGLNEVLQKLRDSNGDAELASRSLVALALDRGAHDNVSVVVAMM